MEWQPIASYDALKKKPKAAVFFFEPLRSNRMELSATIQTERNYGYRVCTHWLPLPDMPIEQARERT